MEVVSMVRDLANTMLQRDFMDHASPALRQAVHRLAPEPVSLSGSDLKAAARNMGYGVFDQEAPPSGPFQQMIERSGGIGRQRFLVTKVGPPLQSDMLSEVEARTGLPLTHEFGAVAFPEDSVAVAWHPVLDRVEGQTGLVRFRPQPQIAGIYAEVGDTSVDVPALLARAKVNDVQRSVGLVQLDTPHQGFHFVTRAEAQPIWLERATHFAKLADHVVIPRAAAEELLDEAGWDPMNLTIGLKSAGALVRGLGMFDD